MSDQLLVVLRVCLLVLVYLVFLRMLRVVWVELKSGAPARSAAPPVREPAAAAFPASAAGAGSEPRQIRALHALEPAGLAGTTFVLDAETTIGRAAGCRISIDDTHVSKVHARVFQSDGRWFVEDLGSTNGTLVNDVMVGHPTPVEVGDRIHVGETVLELR